VLRVVVYEVRVKAERAEVGGETVWTVVRPGKQDEDAPGGGGDPCRGGVSAVVVGIGQ
jgi:hypothetical protein